MARILIVEDHPDIRRTLEMILRQAEFQVASAQDALEALKMINGGGLEFDLIITDIIMPNIDGVDLIRRLKSRFPECRMIAISGGNASLPAAYALQLAQVYSVDDVLYKPFAPDELLDAVRRVLAGDGLMARRARDLRPEAGA